jgi:hypothetical protein
VSEPPSPQPPATVSTEKPVHYLEFTIRFFLADLVVRYALLAAFRYGGLPKPLFWIGQVGFAIGLFVFLMQRDERLMAKYAIAKGERLEPKGASWGVFGLVFSAQAVYQIFGTVHVQPSWLRFALIAILSAVAVGYYAIVAGCSYSRYDARELGGDIDDTPEDENDRILIRLRTELAAQERRIESYTVESTLIGALAFSAFVTIVTSEKVPQAEAIGGVGKDLSTALAKLASLNIRDAKSLLLGLSTEMSLLVIVATLSVTCAIFFLTVIVARLRFNSLVGLASYSIEVAGALNQKEESLHLQQFSLQGLRPDVDARLRYLRERIKGSLEEAQLIAQQLAPIVLYMTVFRHLGVLTFLLALVASAVWISPILAVAFAVVSLGAYSYPVIDRKLRDHNLLRHAFFRLPAFFRK